MSARKSTKSAPKARKAKTPTAETIAAAVNARTGNGLVVTTSNGRSIVVARVDAKVNQLAKLGQSVAPLEEYLTNQPKPVGRLARGIGSGDAPQSAAAVASARAKEAKAAPAKAGKAEKRAAPKAAKNKQPSRGSVRTYKLGKRKDESRAGTFRTYMLSTIMAHKDTDSAKAAHAKSKQYPSHKLDFNWAAQQGYIEFTN